MKKKLLVLHYYKNKKQLKNEQKVGMRLPKMQKQEE